MEELLAQNDIIKLINRIAELREQKELDEINAELNSAAEYDKIHPMNDAEVETAINRKGLNAPRVTPSRIKHKIKNVSYHVFSPTQLTVCCITLKNGFTVTGESACISPENYDEEIGKSIALTNAENKIWMLESYLLKQHMYEEGVV